MADRRRRGTINIPTAEEQARRDITYGNALQNEDLRRAETANRMEFLNRARSAGVPEGVLPNNRDAVRTMDRSSWQDIVERANRFAAGRQATPPSQPEVASPAARAAQDRALPAGSIGAQRGFQTEGQVNAAVGQAGLSDVYNHPVGKGERSYEEFGGQGAPIREMLKAPPGSTVPFAEEFTAGGGHAAGSTYIPKAGELRRPFMTTEQGWGAKNMAGKFADRADASLDPNYIRGLEQGQYGTKAEHALAFPWLYHNDPDLKTAPQNVRDAVNASMQAGISPGGTLPSGKQATEDLGWRGTLEPGRKEVATATAEGRAPNFLTNPQTPYEKMAAVGYTGGREGGGVVNPANLPEFAPTLLSRGVDALVNTGKTLYAGLTGQGDKTPVGVVNSQAAPIQTPTAQNPTPKTPTTPEQNIDVATATRPKDYDQF